MGDRKEIKQTIVFIGFLILSGVCYLFTGTDSLFLNTVMFSANFLIYAGLLLYWIQSVRSRLLPTKARAYILAAALLMLLYLTLRVFKYRIAEADAIPSRVAVYAYWIPQVMIPTLFLMTCIRIRRGERENDPHREMLLLIPAIALSLMVMTNDLHGLVYAPKVDLLEFAVKTASMTKDGDYSLCIQGNSVLLETGKTLRLLKAFGDVDGDDTVNILDATLIQKHLAEFTDEYGSLLVDLNRRRQPHRFYAADVNRDGVINISDVTALQIMIAE